MTLRKGLTLIELVIVIGITLILLSFSLVNTSRSKSFVTVDSALHTLINDVKSQQNKALTIGPSYGIHFESSKYSLFNSVTYDQNNALNFDVTLGEGLQISQINLPNNEIVFSSSSGAIDNFDEAQNSVSLTLPATGETKTFFINKYGVIYRLE